MNKEAASHVKDLLKLIRMGNSKVWDGTKATGSWLMSDHRPKALYPVLGAAALSPVVGSMLSASDPVEGPQKLAELRDRRAELSIKKALTKQAGGPPPPPPSPPPAPGGPSGGGPPSPGAGMLSPSPFPPPSSLPPPAALPQDYRARLERMVARKEPENIVRGLDGIREMIGRARQNRVHDTKQ